MAAVGCYWRLRPRPQLVLLADQIPLVQNSIVALRRSYWIEKFSLVLLCRALLSIGLGSKVSISTSIKITCLFQNLSIYSPGGASCHLTSSFFVLNVKLFLPTVGQIFAVRKPSSYTVSNLLSQPEAPAAPVLSTSILFSGSLGSADFSPSLHSVLQSQFSTKVNTDLLKDLEA